MGLPQRSGLLGSGKPSSAGDSKHARGVAGPLGSQVALSHHRIIDRQHHLLYIKPVCMFIRDIEYSTCTRLQDQYVHASKICLKGYVFGAHLTSSVASWATWATGRGPAVPPGSWPP